jgi:hypothetical protein
MEPLLKLMLFLLLLNLELGQVPLPLHLLLDLPAREPEGSPMKGQVLLLPAQEPLLS